MSDTLLRLLREDDAADVAALYRSTYGADRPMDAEEVVRWFRNPELRNDLLRVLEVDGRVVGYGDLLIANDEVALDLAAPSRHWAPFFDWAEEHARVGGLSRVRAYFPAGHELAAFVERRGYRLWRSSYTMEIELGDATPEAPSPPAGIELRVYRPADADHLQAALNEAFANDPFFQQVTPASFKAFYLEIRGFDPSLWFLAWDGDELAGFALGVAERAGDGTLGWVESLGVRAPWRRRGLATALLRASFRELHARGLRRIGLGVDGENETGAVQLYERVGMHAVRRGDNWMLDL